MLTMRDSYVHETLARLDHSRRRGAHAHAQALAAERSRRPLARGARVVGRALLALGTRLLSYGGGRARAAHAELVPYTAPSTYSRN